MKKVQASGVFILILVYAALETAWCSQIATNIYEHREDAIVLATRGLQLHYIQNGNLIKVTNAYFDFKKIFAGNQGAMKALEKWNSRQVLISLAGLAGGSAMMGSTLLFIFSREPGVAVFSVLGMLSSLVLGVIVISQSQTLGYDLQEAVSIFNNKNSVFHGRHERFLVTFHSLYWKF